jgi:hypothetical protein
MSGAVLSPRQLLEAAAGLESQHLDPALARVWPRAAAVLTRQALESQLVVVLGARFPGIQDCPCRAQLLCLQTYLADKDLAGEVAQAWWALTGACHHRLYELAPSASEIAGWMDTVSRFIGVTEAMPPADSALVA